MPSYSPAITRAGPAYWNADASRYWLSGSASSSEGGIATHSWKPLMRSLPDTPPACQTPLLARIRDSLRLGALDLTHLSLELLRTERPSLPPDHLIVMNICGRGDKDIFAVADHLGVRL